MAKYEVIKAFELEGRKYYIGDVINEVDFPEGSRRWLRDCGCTAEVPAKISEE